MDWEAILCRTIISKDQFKVSTHMVAIPLRCVDGRRISLSFYDSTTRCQSAIDAIRDLATCSNIFDLLVEYILHPDSPQDYLLSASDILCKVLVREIPGVSQPVLAHVPRIATHIIRHRFIDDTTHWQIQPLSEIVLCAMSYMSVKMLQCYRATSPDALASVPAATLNERHSQFNSLLGLSWIVMY